MANSPCPRWELSLPPASLLPLEKGLLALVHVIPAGLIPPAGHGSIQKGVTPPGLMLRRCVFGRSFQFNPMIKLRPIALLAPLGLAVAVAVEANPANAALTYYLSDTAGGLVIETSGSLSLPSPKTYNSSCSYDDYGACWGDEAIVCTGGKAPIPVYSISGPLSFTVGSPLFSSEFTSASGIATGLYGSDGEYAIASSYIAGQPIISRATALD